MAAPLTTPKKVLLLNPPGDQMYLRDYYCSTISKAGYYWHPVDLLVQSGFLRRHFELFFIDAILDRLSREECLRRILSFQPDAVLFLSGTQSWREDFSFLKQVKNLTGSLIIGSGEIFLPNPADAMKEFSFIDAISSDFTTPDIFYFLTENHSQINNMVYRWDNRIVSKSVLFEVREFSLPLPAHELFLSKNYHLPFVPSHIYATLLTNFGCPFHCRFCNSGSFGFKTRNIENILAELDLLSSLGCQHIFVKDMNFPADRGHAFRFCHSIVDSKITISWNCYARPDLIDEDLILAMKASGCRLIQFGIESADRKILKEVGKDISPDRIQHAFDLCRHNHIRTGAHFILGLPGETPDSLEKTQTYIQHLNPSYISLNVFSPRKGSKLPSANAFDYRRLVRFRNEIYKKFYLRPGYLLRLIREGADLQELFSSMNFGLNLLKNLVFSSN